jgi:2-polyprenyl-6-methoxyphenol hydroxylase-like FAD-dependent oxidoreductase
MTEHRRQMLYSMKESPLMRGHVEIAGAGLAGLSLASLLAERGWTAQVHEKEPTIREVGAGIYLKPNGLNALAAVGVLDEVKALGTQLEGAERLDGRGRIIESRPAGGASQIWSIPREPLIQLLHKRALTAGVAIRTESHITGVLPEGTLTDTAGKRFEADVVVCADGVGSILREMLALSRSVQRLETVATRYLIPTRALSPQNKLREYWSGSRRIAFAPSGADATYVYVICRDDDAPGLAQPLDVASWTRSFPALRDQFEVLTNHGAVQHNYPLVQCRRWGTGRAAVLGDAAHALPPTLGQGANLAMSNALALAECLERGATVESALRTWEDEYRKYADVTQTWSMRYDQLTWRWPRGLEIARKTILWALNLPPLARRVHVADTMGSHRVESSLG